MSGGATGPDIGGFERTRPDAAARSRREERRRLVRAAVIAFAAGIVGGVLHYLLGSSRGLDLIEATELLTIAFVIASIALVLGGVARALMLGDRILLAVLPAFLLGAVIASGNTIRLVPGDTTDGTMVLVFPGQPDPAAPGRTIDPGAPPIRREPLSIRAACRWAPDGSRVVEVRARRPLGLSPSPEQPEFREVRIVVLLDAGTIRLLTTATPDAALRR